MNYRLYNRLQRGLDGEWTETEAGGVLQIIDQICSPNTTFAGLNGVYDWENANYELGNELNSTEEVIDNSLDQGMQERVIPFIKEVRKRAIIFLHYVCTRIALLIGVLCYRE